MMRTIEIFLVIIIITGAFIISSFFAVLPSPRQVSPLSLERLALTTLETLDRNYDLSETVFNESNNLAWGQLKIALSASLPPNIVYNLTIYEVQSEGGTELYKPIKSISNAECIGIDSDSASYLVASSNVTFNVIPEKIGEHGGGGTLYILNCSDANGWWITGYTAHSLAEDLNGMLSPYFQTTIMVQNTTQLGQILNGTSLQNETLQDAVVVNTFGEAVPIPTVYCEDYELEDEGYFAGVNYTYTRYCYTLGERTHLHNWTWISIVGYPLYYVSNTQVFANEQNDWGIYGMKKAYRGGINAFLQGLDNQSFKYNETKITGSPGDVYLSSESINCCNYYGIYPAPHQTSTRALQSWITSTYHLTATTYIFNPVGNLIAGAVYRHADSGALMALGLTRTPDIRLTALGLLTDYKPRLYCSEYTANGTSRLVILQLGQVGGI